MTRPPFPTLATGAAFIVLALAQTISIADADTKWNCTFPGDSPEHHTYIERQTDLIETDVNIYQGSLTPKKGEVRYPFYIRTAYDVFAARAWPVLSDNYKQSLAGSTILMIDLRTSDATLTQVVTSVDSQGTRRGKCVAASH